MRLLVRSISGGAYRSIIKPILFHKSPDSVHSKTIKLGSRVQSMPLLGALPGLWAQPRDKRLRQTVMGVSFSNPIGLSAGFDKNIQLAPLLKRIGFGFMIGGSVTAVACDGNPRPWFYRLPRTRSLVVYAGLPNQGVKRISKRILQYPRQLFQDFPLVVSVAKTNAEFTVEESVAIDDYCASLVHLERNDRVAVYEINISCPNAYGGEPFTEPGMLDRLLRRIDALELTRPVIIKMPIDLEWGAFRELLEVIVRHDVRGVTIGNLLKNRSRAGLKDELPDTIKGGLSGMPTQPISNELIRQTYLHYGDKLTIIGVGGVFSVEDAYTKIRLGASLVGMITGLMFVGPQIVGEINAALLKLLERDGFTSIADVVGVDALDHKS